MWSGRDKKRELTALGLLVLREELHRGALQRRGHLVGILEFLGGPFPEFVHVVRYIVGDVGAVFGDLGSLLGLWGENLSVIETQSSYYSRGSIP